MKKHRVHKHGLKSRDRSITGCYPEYKEMLIKCGNCGDEFRSDDFQRLILTKQCPKCKKLALMFDQDEYSTKKMRIRRKKDMEKLLNIMRKKGCRRQFPDCPSSGIDEICCKCPFGIK